MAKFKACPFCGCSVPPAVQGNGIGDNWLECTECGASTRLREDGAGSEKDWNRRTPRATAEQSTLALQALVAAGHVSQAKVDEALSIAAKTPGIRAAEQNRDSVIEECIAALYPLASLGGPCDMQAFHDLEDNVVVYQNSGACITAGDARHARELIAKITGKAVSMMHHRLFDPEEATFAENYRLDVIEECCAAIKAEDDRMAADDYMLDSNDCIKVCRALKSPLANPPPLEALPDQ